MKSNYKYFNLVCLGLSLIFVLGILWLWRGSFVKSRKDFLDVKIIKNIEELKYEKSLPKEINLDVPFTSQAPEKNWGQPWQDACEEAVVLMLDAYYKEYNLSPLFAKDEILKMVDWEENVMDWGRSIEIEKVQMLYDEFILGKSQPEAGQPLADKVTNFKSKVIVDPTVEQIKKFIAVGNPVLVVADGKVLPNPHFRAGGPEYHALIIRGYTEDSFITNDPGTQFGENFVYKYDELMNAIHDWNGGDVKNGRSVVLVID